MAFAGSPSSSRNCHRRQARRRTVCDPLERHRCRTRSKRRQIMLVEREALVRRIPGLLDGLSTEDRSCLLRIGQKRSFDAEQPLFRQGDAHNGIFLIESGRIRSYYVAPSGREVTLAYWFPGNFVGAPDIFGGGTHMWASSAVQRTATIFLPGLGSGGSPSARRRLPWLYSTRCRSRLAAIRPWHRCSGRDRRPNNSNIFLCSLRLSMA